ncbi:major facilitator superfamily domain-containing protein [Aspergillus varians]
MPHDRISFEMASGVTRHHAVNNTLDNEQQEAKATPGSIPIEQEKKPKHAPLVIFCISGLATAMCVPSATSIISENFSSGKLRNLAFSFMGGGQPIGFGVGILVGGILTDTIGWRWGFHTAAIANTAAFLLSWWQLPHVKKGWVNWHSLVFEIDWFGAIIVSIALALLSLALAAISSDVKKIHQASTITYFAISAILLLSFALWQEYQERHNQPTLIRNSLWKNLAFSSICANAFIIWGAFNGFEQIINFFFQNLHPLHPNPNAIMNMTTLISCISPLIMALVDPSWTYWRCAFIAISLNSIAADSLFTVSNILIAGVFPPETHGVAAGVFNTISQVGKSFGLTFVELIADVASDSKAAYEEERNSPEGLMAGYRAAFWFLFAINVLSLGVGAFGLRRVGNIGKKKAL